MFAMVDADGSGAWYRHHHQTPFGLFSSDLAMVCTLGTVSLQELLAALQNDTDLASVLDLPTRHDIHTKHLHDSGAKLTREAVREQYQHHQLF